MQPTPEDIAAADRVLGTPHLTEDYRAYCFQCVKTVLVVQPRRENNKRGVSSYIEGMCGTCSGTVRVIA